MIGIFRFEPGALADKLSGISMQFFCIIVIRIEDPEECIRIKLY